MEDQKEELGAFLVKCDSEGGYISMLHWGGVRSFPAAVRQEAAEFERAYEALHDAIDAHAKLLGYAYKDEAMMEWERNNGW